jgi:L-iditol 2-dehydrogenase
MNAVRLYGPRDLRLERTSPPDEADLPPGSALIRTRAVGLCGSDLHYYRDGAIGDSRATHPLVLGHEFAAEIVALHPGASAAASAEASLRPGTLVAVDPAINCGWCEHCLAGHPNICPQVRFAGTPPTDGALQDYLIWPAHLLHPLPPALRPELGALLEPLGVLIHAVDLAKIRLADTVAVLGAGPIGLLAIRLARLSGAVQVLATDLLPARVAAAREFGADDALDATLSDPVTWIQQQTAGRGVDVVIECAGAAQTAAQAVAAVRPGGTVVLVGIPADDRIEFNAAQARRKGVTIKLCRRMKHVYRRAIALVAGGLVDPSPLVSHRFPLAETTRAFDLLDQGADGVLKPVIHL